MREYKFRGKRKDDVWVYGSLVIGTDGKSTYIFTLEGAQWTVLPESVGQFSGLTDRNGKDVYEGDIVSVNGVVYQVKWVEDCAKYGVKVIKSEAVLVRGLTFPIQQYVDTGLKCVFEIIGNIFENPELLEKA